MKNILLAVGTGAWLAFGGKLALNKYHEYQLSHPAPAVVSASKYTAAQNALKASQAQIQALQAQNHQLACAQKPKTKGC